MSNKVRVLNHLRGGGAIGVCAWAGVWAGVCGVPGIGGGGGGTMLAEEFVPSVAVTDRELLMGRA